MPRTHVQIGHGPESLRAYRNGHPNADHGSLGDRRNLGTTWKYGDPHALGRDGKPVPSSDDIGADRRTLRSKAEPHHPDGMTKDHQAADTKDKPPQVVLLDPPFAEGLPEHWSGQWSRCGLPQRTHE